MYIITYEQGSIVLLPFPFSDLEGMKKRPALVLSNADSQEKTGRFICMMITSAMPVNEYDIVIQNWEAAGLLKPSVAKVNRVFTINQELAIKVLGKLEHSDFYTIFQAFFRLFQERSTKFQE